MVTLGAGEDSAVLHGEVAAETSGVGLHRRRRVDVEGPARALASGAVVVVIHRDRRACSRQRRHAKSV